MEYAKLVLSTITKEAKEFVAASLKKDEGRDKEEEREDGSDRDSDESDFNAEKHKLDDNADDGGHKKFFNIKGIKIEIKKAMKLITNDAYLMQSEIELTRMGSSNSTLTILGNLQLELSSYEPSPQD